MWSISSLDCAPSQRAGVIHCEVDGIHINIKALELVCSVLILPVQLGSGSADGNHHEVISTRANKNVERRWKRCCNSNNLTPNIQQETTLGLQLFNVSLASIDSTTKFVTKQLSDSSLYVFCHFISVTTDIHNSSLVHKNVY
jgi:hypothetical protein